MSKPKIYAACDAGCLWETVHKSDFDKSAYAVPYYPNSNGEYIFEKGKTYVIKKPSRDSLGMNIWLYAKNSARTIQCDITTYWKIDEFVDYFKIKLLDVSDHIQDVSPDTVITIYVFEIDGARYSLPCNSGTISEGYVIDEYDECYLYATDISMTNPQIMVVNDDATLTASSVHIRYSVNADGSDFTNEWSEGQNYIGIASATEVPTSKEQFTWTRIADLVNIVQKEGAGTTVAMSQKAVTEALAQISVSEKVVIDSTYQFTDSHYIMNDGTIVDGGGSWFISDFIPVFDFKVISFRLKAFNSNVVLDTVTFYDSNLNRIGGLSYPSEKTDKWETQIIIPEECRYIKCLYYAHDDFEPCVILAKETVDVPLSEEDINNSKQVVKFGGAFWNASSYDRWYRTKAIDVKGFSSVSFHLSAFHSASDNMALNTVSFYDANGGYISGAFCAIHDLCVKDVIQTVPIPSNAVRMYALHMPELDYEPYIKLNYKEKGVTNIVCIGDSLTEGYTANNIILKENYPNFLQEKLGTDYTVLNCGVGGSQAQTWWNNHKQYLNINDSNTDIILIMLGGNYGLDDTFETAVDPYDNYNDYGNTISGNTCKLLEWLEEQAPNAQIVMLTPTYADATKALHNATQMNNQCLYMPKITERYHYPVIDVRNLHGVNKHNSERLLASDGLHGTEEFYSRLGAIVANQLKAISNR